MSEHSKQSAQEAEASPLVRAEVQDWRSQRVRPELRAEMDALYADYAAALDQQRYQDWLKFFTDDCRYTIQSRENHARALPLAAMAFESLGMLKDRVYGVVETLIHQPYSQRHVFGPLRFLHTQDLDDPTRATLRLECNYAVFRVKLNHLPEVFSVGRYLDTWRFAESGWKLADKLVVYDSDLVANSMIYPL
jgi:salicylate 5-hydroxylase small subunit